MYLSPHTWLISQSNRRHFSINYHIIIYYIFVSDANQNNITEKILPINGERIFVPKPPVHSDLLDENFDMRGDSFDTWSSTSESSNGTTDLVNANTRPLSRKSENEIYSTLSRRNSEASSVCSGSEDLNVDAGMLVEAI